MNMKRLIAAFVAVLVTATLGNFLIHGILLKPEYQQSASLLRAEADGAAHAPFLMLGFLFFSLSFTWMYAQGVNEKPWVGQGLRFGLAVWLVASAARYVVDYAVAPWPGAVVMKQIGYELPLMLILGAVVAAIYKK